MHSREPCFMGTSVFITLVKYRKSDDFGFDHYLVRCRFLVIIVKTASKSIDPMPHYHRKPAGVNLQPPFLRVS